MATSARTTPTSTSASRPDHTAEHRRTFDLIFTTGGLVVAIGLLVAGGLLTWGHAFVDDQVHGQLAAQKIFFPPKGSAALSPSEFPDLQKYAGQQVVNGDQARAFADGFIGRHLTKIGGGKTYSELSSASLAQPGDTALAAKVQTLFRGETLRGLLLNAYAFGTMAKVALYAAIVTFIGAAIMLILSVLGIAHLRRASQTVDA